MKRCIKKDMQTKTIRTFSVTVLSLMLLCGGIYAQSEKQTDVVTFCTECTQNEIDSLYNEAINNGNTDAFDKMITFKEDSTLQLSYLMYSKHKYNGALWSVYKYLTDLHLKNQIPMDSTTMTYTFNILKESADMGETRACRRLSDYYYFGVYVERDTTMSQSYFYKSYSPSKESMTPKDSARAMEMWTLYYKRLAVSRPNVFEILNLKY